MSYRYMRMILMFDMPVDTTEERKAYRKFRKFLIDEGFIMHQFSIYSKLLLNNSANNAMIERLKTRNPKKGKHYSLNCHGKTVFSDDILKWRARYQRSKLGYTLGLSRRGAWR